MYSVNIIGFTWEGFESTYTYNGFTTLPDAPAIKCKAGDFQDICDFQILSYSTKTVRKGNRITRTEVTTIVRDWKDEDSEGKFAESQMN